MAQDGEIRQQDGDPENLRGDQRHDARFAPVSVCPSTCLRFFFTSLMSLCVRIFTWFNLPACPCFSCPSTVCVLLPCYGDDERGRSVISTVRAVIAGLTVCCCFLKEHIA